jgi:predicted PurR-regulated permease PerM
LPGLGNCEIMSRTIRSQTIRSSSPIRAAERAAMAPHPPARDITRATLAVLFIAILIAACFWILRPFLMATVWASTIVIATWPLMLRVQARLWGKRALAVLVMTLLLLLVLVIPLSAAIASIVGRSDDIVTWARSLATFSVPVPPDWVGRLPAVGPRLTARWQQLASAGPGAVSANLAPHAGTIARWLIAQAGSIGIMVLQFLLTLIVSAVLYANGERTATGVCRFTRRLAGQHGEDAALLAARAVRSVALGVVLTALIQTLLGGIGLAASGVPAAALLTAVMFVLCVAQLGPGLVLIPAVIWLFWTEQTVWGSIMAVWAVFVGTLDNFIRPILIRKGADLPLLLIFAGVIGGLIAFGVIGLFIGPVLLAVTYTLLQAWVAGDESAQAAIRDDKL